MMGMVSACASVAAGPSVMVLPGNGKSYDESRFHSGVRWRVKTLDARLRGHDRQAVIPAPAGIQELYRPWPTALERSEEKMARILRRRSKRSRKTATPKERVCLRCDRRFLSEGPHNRLCQTCREYLADAPTPVEEYHFSFP